LRTRLICGLRQLYPGIHINEAATEHQLPGTVNATFPGKDGMRLLAGLDCYEVCVSIGSACTAEKVEPSHVLLGMGHSEDYANSTVRFSMGSTTSKKDIDYCIRALADVLKGDPEGFRYLDPKELTEERIRSSEVFLIDLRFSFERMLVPSISGANQWSYIGFERFHPRIPRDKKVVLVCSTGMLSLGAGYKLASSGHPDVNVIFGGYNAWRAWHPGLLEKLQAGEA
jgi:rhodanese-related sulfurtransferase